MQQLIKQKKLDMTLEESKDLVQGLLNILPLPEKDSKRVQAEKEFIAGNVGLRRPMIHLFSEVYPNSPFSFSIT